MSGKKCTISKDGRNVEPCKDLDECSEYGNPTGKRKGIFAWVYHNRSTGAKRTFFGAKSGIHLKNGLVFNFCPFCGVKIDGPIYVDSKTTKQ